jgi:hypothetical protein
MPDLVSPGVSVTVTNESFYTSAPTGTVPLIVIATAQDKLQPGTASVAQYTTKDTAGQLKLVTSQRDVLQLYGAPNFYSVGGTPQYDNQLNEVGLFSLYEFLGIANNAYVIRADIDLTQLKPRSTEPTGTPTNGSYWLDTSQSVWGTFVSNGNPNPAFAWSAVAPMVITDSMNLENIIQGRVQLDPVTPTAPITSASANAVVDTGTISINGVPVSLTSAMTLPDIANAINGSKGLQLLGVSAEIFSHNEISDPVVSTQVTTVYNLRLKINDINNTVYFDEIGNDAPLIQLGFVNPDNTANYTPLNIASPLRSFGTAGELAVDTVSVSPGANGTYKNRIWEKISVVTGFGLNSFTKDWWFAVGTTEQSTITDSNNTDYAFAGWGWQEAEPLVVTASKSNPVMDLSATAATITIGGQNVVVAPSDIHVSSLVTNINAGFTTLQVNAHADLYTTGINTYLRITNYDGTTVRFHDTTNGSSNGIWTTVGIDTSQTYFGSVTGTSAVSSFTTGDKFTVDIGAGAQTITVASSPSNDISNVVAQINTAVGASIATAPNNHLTLSRAGTYIKVQQVKGTPLDHAGIETGNHYGRQAFFQDYYPALAVPSTLPQLAAKSIWLNTTSQNRGADTVVKQYANGTWTTQNTAPNTGTIPWFRQTSDADISFGSRKSVGSIFMQYNPDNSIPSQMTMQLMRWDGTTWSSAGMGDQTWMYSPKTTAPQGSPADGTLWYNTTLQVDIMVNTGRQWVGYKNLYPGTDNNGVIISGSAPLTQSNGNALVDYDIWLDSSQSTYPVLNRYVSSSRSWVQIDNTDHVTPGGIIFEDARSNAGAEYNYSVLNSTLVLSDYVDSDVPDAELYPTGMLLFNTRYSTNNVKRWSANYFGAGMGTWVTASGNNPGDLTPYMGTAAQRIMVVQALQGALQASEDARAEQTYFNLIATPGYPECIDEMVTLNTDKKQIAFVVGDTPAHLAPTGTAIVNWATNAANAYDNGDAGLITHDDYTAVWYPWALSTNLDGSYVFVPPSMMALRTIAFNDQVAYPWFAPAGFNRGLVTGVNSVGYLNSIGEYKALTLNQGQRDVMYSHSINPIAYIPNRGLVIYGQKTLSATTSAMDRINVARLINYLKYQLDNVAKSFLFEPNDKQTRDAVLTTFNGFFNNLVGLRAIYDFAVICDETNNTPARIDANQLWIDVAIKPEKAIEFIYIPIRLLNTGDPMPNGTR